MASYNVEKLKAIANRAQGFNENAAPIISPQRTAPQQSGNFFGNILGSIGRLGGQSIGGIGNILKQTFFNEPKALLGEVLGGIKKQYDITRNQLGAVQQSNDIMRRIKAGQPVSQQELAALRSRTQQNLAQTKAASWQVVSPFIVGTKSYREKYLPVAGTIATLATLGTAAPVSAGAKGATAAPKALTFGQRAGRFGGNLVTDIFGVGKTFGKNLPMNIVGKIARNELLVQPTLQDIANLPGQIGQGKFGEAGLNAALIASGGLQRGPLGTIGSIASKAKTKFEPTFKSGAGVFDLVKIKGGETVMQAFQKAAAANPKQAGNIENTLKVYQDYLIRQWGDAKTASKAFNEYIGNKDLSKMNLNTLVKELDNFRNSDVAIKETAMKLAKKGLLTDASGRKITVDQAKYVGAVRSPGGSTDDLVVSLSTTKNPSQVKKAIAKFKKDNPDFVKIPQNRRVLQGLEESGESGQKVVDLANKRFIKTEQVFFGGKAKVSPEGYTAGLRSGVAFKSPTEVAALKTGKNGKLAFFGNTLSKLGISPESGSQGKIQYISNKVKLGFDNALEQSGINRTANEILSTLGDLAQNRKGVFDIRQLTSNEVAKALRVDKNDAKTILRAYKKSISKLSLDERGLAGKITDFNLNYNPLAAPYSRLQNAAKYEINPFFSIQERVEARVGVAALGGGIRKPGVRYDKQIDELDELGFWKGASFGSEGADVGNIGNITSKLKPGQKQTIAAGIEALAGKQGKTISEFVTDPKNADIMQDFKTIVQYPDKGFTSSNLSKMMNLLIFPSRYNIKVTQFALKQIAKQPGIVQAQILRGIGDYNNFMNSPEGYKFQADNKEVFQLLNYFTPLNNITQIMNILTGRARTPADFGLIGGLPFGIISQGLQGQGLIQTDTPYVDPRTGEIYPDRIPQTLKARTYQLLSDLIGSMYNYPGRQIGVPRGFSKKDVNEIIPRMLLGEKSPEDFATVTRTNISPEDAKRIQALSALEAGPGGLRIPTSIPAGAKFVDVKKLKEEDIIKGFNFPKAKKAKKAKIRPVPIQQLLK